MIKILHVDDSENDLLLVKLKLEQLSKELDLTTIDRAEKALEILEKAPYDCIVSDYQMPGMDGLEFLQKLRTTNTSVPFIFLTGQGSEETAAEALRAGADDYFTKGEGLAHYERLLNSIRRLFEIQKAKQISNEAREALRISEERFRLAFKTSPDSININRLEDGVYVDINDGFTEITGYTEKDVIGRSSIEINIWNNPQDRRQLIKRLQNDAYVKNHEAFFRLKDGSLRSGLMSARVINLNGEPHILSLTRDITQIRAAEKEAQKHERDYRLLFQRTSDAVFRVEKKTGRYLEANAAAEKLTGRTLEELQQLTTGKFTPLGAEERIKLANTDSETFDMGEVVYKRPDGSKRIALLEGISIDDDTLFGIARDITIRKNAEEALRSSKERFRSYIDHAPHGVFVVDIAGKLVDVNVATCNTSGFSREKIIGRHFSDFVESSQLEFALEHFEQVKKNGKATNKIALIHKDGSTAYYQINSVRLTEDSYLGNLHFSNGKR